jgi:hypothetical protein
MDIFKVTRSLLVLYSSNLFRIHFDTLHTDDEAQVFDLLVVELAFLWFEVQACLLQCFQDPVDMFLVFFKSVGVNEGIIKICSAKSVEVGSENIVDEILEGGWGIGETKCHNQGLEKAISGSEGSLPFLPFHHSNEVIGPADVQFRKLLCPRQVHEGILHKGKWIAVLDCPLVNSPVVDNQL